MFLPFDANGKPIQLAISIKTDSVTLTNTDYVSISKPANAVALRITSDDYFELKAGDNPIKTNDDEFGCVGMQSLEIKGNTGQVVYLRWELL